jgi:hypothetical protein
MKHGFAQQGLSKRRNEILLILATGLACIWVNSAAATEVYTWTDEDGIVHYSDLPTSQQDSQVINVDGADRPGTTGAYPQDIDSADSPSAVDDPGASQLSAAQERRKQIAENREENREDRAISEKMCTKHRQLLEKMEPARRVYYTDEKGENVRMDDTQRVGMIEESKDYISKNCE